MSVGIIVKIQDRAQVDEWGERLIASYAEAMRKTIHLTLRYLEGTGDVSREDVLFAADACGEYERLTLAEFLDRQVEEPS